MKRLLAGSILVGGLLLGSTLSAFADSPNASWVSAPFSLTGARFALWSSQRPSR